MPLPLRGTSLIHIYINGHTDCENFFLSVLLMTDIEYVYIRRKPGIERDFYSLRFIPYAVCSGYIVTRLQNQPVVWSLFVSPD